MEKSFLNRENSKCKGPVWGWVWLAGGRRTRKLPGPGRVEEAEFRGTE